MEYPYEIRMRENGEIRFASGTAEVINFIVPVSGRLQNTKRFLYNWKLGLTFYKL